LPKEAQEGHIPLLIPGEEKRKAEFRREQWHIFGALEAQTAELPREPRDHFATFGILPGPPETLARRYTFKAYTLEIISWLALLAGIGLNIFFVGMIITLI
jgi:hypothetical protein